MNLSIAIRVERTSFYPFFDYSQSSLGNKERAAVVPHSILLYSQLRKVACLSILTVVVFWRVFCTLKLRSPATKTTTVPSYALRMFWTFHASLLSSVKTQLTFTSCKCTRGHFNLSHSSEIGKVTGTVGWWFNEAGSRPTGFNSPSVLTHKDN